jgi:hypothetical protein
MPMNILGFESSNKVDGSNRQNHITAVRFLKTIWVVALALAWMPITAHCTLEVLPALEFLACCAHEEAATPHQDDDCERDGCAAVESGEYRTQEQHVLVTRPDFAGRDLEFVAVELNEGPAESSFSILTTALPEEHPVLHLALRTALRVRAPSFTS